ncbi:hypothetical protein [Shimia marina]|uniref:Uncharacterized protein n=1 Tax=Shimia marina TaxID=321267 RepID=A0A0N7LS96_9RHOB|nr:hypothetical protein [Shimia marina]CUH53004.1 hypothetical protein SHM7688_02455 [Shimia marina]SFD92173.1 hypothetical protein SAMN04488037_103256 [Shimia marina]
MFGVVLWSDPERCKAVIWCEDHRDLAYFDGAKEGVMDHGPNEETASVALGVGDMLLFDVCVTEQRRTAYNLQRVAVAAAEDLVNKCSLRDTSCA